MKRAVSKKEAKRMTAAETICAVYLCLLGVALPLAVHDAYFDITITKASVFWSLGGALAAACALCLLVRKKESGLLAPWGLPDLLIALFALCPILSTLLFQSSSNALTAPDNRCQGVLSFSMYLLVFLLLRRGGRLTPLVRLALLLGASTAALLGVLDIFGLSVLPLRAVSPAIELPRFLSTVGNITFYGALCVLFLPFAAWYALSAKDLRGALPYALCALIALCGCMAARTEASLLGVLAFLAVLPLFSRDERALRRVPLLWAFSSAAALFFSSAMSRWALYPPSELTRLACSPALLLPLGLIAAAVFFLLRGKPDETVRRARKIYILLFWAAACLGALFLVLANTLWRERLPASLASVLVFSPSWGSDRGAEWAGFWRMFRAAPLLKKLIGNGAGSLLKWDSVHPLFPDALTDSAHNEYLHYLLTNGLVGALSYLALLVLAFRRAIKEPSRGRTAAALGCFAYAVQAAVNIAQPFTTPLFFALLALLCADRAFEQNEEPREDQAFLYVAVPALALALLVAAAV